MKMRSGLNRHTSPLNGVRQMSAAHRILPQCPNRVSRSVSVTAAKDWHELPMKHVVDSQQFSRRAMDVIFAEALKMEAVRPGTPEADMLKGYVVSTLFYEPSTRTRLSFESAMGKLGGTVISTESAAEYSSAAKGETLEGACVHSGISGCHSPHHPMHLCRYRHWHATWAVQGGPELLIVPESSFKQGTTS